MSLIKKWFSFYVFANVHVGLAALCLTKITMIAFEIENDSLAYFVFFSTIMSYNFIRIVRLDDINSLISNWMRSNKSNLIILNSLCLISTIYLALSFRLSDLLFLLPFFLLSLLYVLPITSKIKGFRQIPGLKLIIISFTWAGVTVGFPLFASNLLDSEGVWIVFIQRLMFVIAITIPFDIRDAQLDLPGLKTLPQIIGVGKSKVLAILLMIVFNYLEYYSMTEIEISFVVTSLVTIFSVFLILGASERQHRFYSSFWVESIPILWYGMLLISENLTFA
jgi:hypothetical protein